MDHLQTYPLHKISILDEADYHQSGIDLLNLAKKVVEKSAIQAVVLNQAPGLARLYNLTRWQPDASCEYFDRAEVAADVLIHIACHQAVHQRFGSDNASLRLLGEAIASASDLYLVACFAKAGQEPAFLEETLESYTFYYESYGDVETLERLLEKAIEYPDQVTADLAFFLFKFGSHMLQTNDSKHLVSDELCSLGKDLFYPLVHHYHLSNWMLTLKEAGSPGIADLPAGIWQRLGQVGGLQNLLNLDSF